MTLLLSTHAQSKSRRHPAWLAPVLVFLLLAAPLMAVGGYLAQRQDAGEQARIAFSAANNLYASGEYALAQQAYQQMRNQGVESVELYYNLALAQMQLGDGAGAVETLQQAQRLAPRDTRLVALLDRATSLAAGQDATLSADTTPLLPLQASEMALLALILWTAAGALTVGAILTGRAALRILLFVLAFFALVAALILLVL